MKELVNNKSWWNGPTFLTEGPSTRPKQPTTCTNELAEDELLKHPPAVTSSLPCVSEISSVHLENIIDIERYGTKLKLLRVTAIVLRFIKMLKRRSNVHVGALTGEELHSAEVEWIRSVQTNSFINEQQTLMKNNKACLHQFELQLNSDEFDLLQETTR